MSNEEVKAKAGELFYYFYNRLEHTFSEEYEKHAKEFCKMCAIKVAEEVLENGPSRRYWDNHDDETPSTVVVWTEIKQELEKI